MVASVKKRVPQEASASEAPQAGPSNPVKPLAALEAALSREFVQTIQQLETRRVAQRYTDALTESELQSLVHGISSRLPSYEGATEIAKFAIEKTLERSIVQLPDLVAEPWQDDQAHMYIYYDMLDILLAFEDSQQLDTSLIATTMEALIEKQTLEAAEQLFAYMETRTDRLTRGLVSGRGKGLIILRLLNDLLRRLSKSTHTVLCGRILMFLANIFPIGERSGVNLRGEFNKDNVTTFEDPEEVEADPVDEDMSKDEEEDDAAVEKSLLPPKSTKKDISTQSDNPTIAVEAPEDGEEVEEAATNVDEAALAADRKISPAKRADDKRASSEPEFYILFWSMQRYFSDPPSLFQHSVHASLPPILSTYAASFPAVPPVAKDGKVSAVPTAAGTPNLTLFRQGVTKLLDVFHDASREEKALQGAAKDSATRSNMAKRSADAASMASSSEDDVRRMFFYPKFLTSKNLLDLEVADSNFRKQVLVQCLILFRFLHSFTDAAKVKQQASLTHPNRLFLAAGYRLSEADYRWISDLEARTYTEISRTPTDGEYFVKTVKMVLQNERNWLLWKADNCPEIEKKPIPPEESANARALKRKLEGPALGFPHKAGTPALSRLWATQGKDHGSNGRLSSNLQRFFEAVKKQNELVKMRKYELEEEGRTDPADQALDPELRQLEERKSSLAWRTLRVASAGQLHLFGKIGTSVNDIEKLIDAMEAKRSTPAVQTQQTVKAESEVPESSPAVGETARDDADNTGVKRPHPDGNAMDIDDESAKKARLESVASDTPTATAEQA